MKLYAIITAALFLKVFGFINIVFKNHAHKMLKFMFLERSITPSSIRHIWWRQSYRYFNLDSKNLEDDFDIDDEVIEEIPNSYTTKESNKNSSRIKFRQHVNPLASTYQIPLHLSPSWLQESFQDPLNKPLIIDVGCARGSWALHLAMKNPNKNILGLEIRKPVVELALERKNKHGVPNVHYLASNANVDLMNILSSLKTQNIKIEHITIQFPDPHFKNKHKKRKVVNESLVTAISSSLPVGTSVFIQSDVRDVIDDMIEVFNSHPAFEIDPAYSLEALEANISPFEVLTEREIATINKGLPVYRMQFKTKG